MAPICPNCDSEKSEKFAKAGKVLIVKCPDCGLVFKPLKSLSSQNLQKLQDGVYKDLRLRTELEMLYKMAAARLETVKGFKKEGSLLEIGCATGEFLEVAQKAGYETLGVDASKLFSDFARSKGLDVRYGLADDVLLEEDTFDVIVMFHLLEHIPEPNLFLESLIKHLAKGGIIFIICPNIDSITRKPFGYWSSAFQQPDHLVFYSYKTLNQVCEKSGFKVIYSFSKEYPYAFFSILRGYVFLRLGPLKKRILKSLFNKDKNPGPESKSVNRARPAPSLYKSLYTQLPYWLGWLFYPLLRPYGLWVEKKMGGHELCVVAVRKEEGR